MSCICTSAIAGISDGPNVECPEHGERQAEPSDATEVVERMKAAGVGAYSILAAVSKVYEMETKAGDEGR